MPDRLSDAFFQIPSQAGVVFVCNAWREVFEKAGLATFEDWMSLGGRSYREVSMRPKRPVVAIRLEGMTRDLFVKRNLEAPRSETFFQKIGLAPTPSEARKEADKIELFAGAGIPAPEVVAWGEGKWDSIQSASFIVTLDLEALPLERYLFRHCKPPLDKERLEDKRRVTVALAQLTRQMHEAGLVHRDYYLGHVFISEKDDASHHRLTVIDVQRASKRPKWWIRSRIKDLASLHFSADPVYIRKADRVRFLRVLWGVDRFTPLQRLLIAWIDRKAQRIRKHTEKALGIPYSEYFKNKYY
jgi:heptose I phosphotransferase